MPSPHPVNPHPLIPSSLLGCQESSFMNLTTKVNSDTRLPRHNVAIFQYLEDVVC